MTRILLVSVMTLVLLGVLVLGILLIPGHIQIRQVQEVLPEPGELMGNKWLLSEDGPREIRWIKSASQGALSHSSFLISWDDGKSFLIDSGMNRADALAFGELFEKWLGAGPTETFGPVEEQIGAAIQRIEGMAFNHLHSDHTLGLTAICEVQQRPATIFQTSNQSNQQNLHTEDGQMLVADSNCPHVVLPNDIVKPIAGFPGLVAIAAGGHTPGSTIYAARVNGKVWVFAGDLTNRKAAALKNQDKGFLYSYMLVPENTELLAQWRPWLAELDADPNAEVIISHDLAALAESDIQLWEKVER